MTIFGVVANPINYHPLDAATACRIPFNSQCDPGTKFQITKSLYVHVSAIVDAQVSGRVRDHARQFLTP
jgi:hypothetical protein